MLDRGVARVAIPLATLGFDLTEVAVPWHGLVEAGHEVVFATVDGAPAACDPITLAAKLGDTLNPRAENIRLYEQLIETEAFCQPIRYDEIDLSVHDALILPGGHAPETRQFLEDETLHDCAAKFLEAKRVVGAICHGPVLLSRATRSDGRPLLEGRTLTALTKPMEWIAWVSTRSSLGDHYRTYPEWVETELRRALGTSGRFRRGPLIPSYKRPFVVEDANLITARYPGDAVAFTERIIQRLG